MQDILVKFSDDIKYIYGSIQEIEATWAAALPLNETTNRSDKERSIYSVYPFLFSSVFPSVSRSDIRTLAVSGRLYFDSLLFADKIMDDKLTLEMTTNYVLKLQALQYEASKILHTLYSSESPFWLRFTKNWLDYTSACHTEKKFMTGELAWGDYTEEKAFEIARGKCGIARTAVSGLAILANCDQVEAALYSSIENHYVARQFWDDISDWKKDFKENIPSLLLSRVMDGPLHFSNEEESDSFIQQLKYEVYYNGHLEYLLDLALHKINDARQNLNGIDAPEWSRVISHLEQDCVALLRDVQGIVQKNLQRATSQPQLKNQIVLPKPTNQSEKLIYSCVETLLTEWQKGFGELRHLMRLPLKADFTIDHEYHYGDVFQRALMTDGLCDANDLLDGRLQSVLDYEVQYLIDSRDTNTSVGGWRYMPNVPEVAPDADDFGQVMQAFLRSGSREYVQDYCETPLGILLANNVRDDGGIETWIVPRENQTEEQQRQVYCNNNLWGTGPDNEVVANILYALALYDKQRFMSRIQSGIEYLLSRQETNGHWVSRWYTGAYYGTYVSLRLLAEMGMHEKEQFQNAITFLLQTQNPDGGWGLDSTSDVLSTSLALLGLATAPAQKLPQEILICGLQFLANNWETQKVLVDFIEPRGTGAYRSKTMNTMYAMKAAAALYKQGIIL